MATITPSSSASPLHDVYADNRSENVFGWVQPDEWETVAGPNKHLFVRAQQCAQCRSSPPSPLPCRNDAVPKHPLPFDAVAVDMHPPGSCGAPSCGYGADCCAYSRNASATTTAASLPQLAHARKRPRPSSDFGVTLTDILHRRSCRPISLADLRAFLLAQRVAHRRHPAYVPASDMARSRLLDLDLNLDLDTKRCATATSPPPLPPPCYDEVDALDFLVAYERYRAKWRQLTKAVRQKSPDAAAMVATEDALRPHDALRLDPETQPLRSELDHIVARYLGGRGAAVGPTKLRRAWIAMTKTQVRRPGSGSSDAVTLICPSSSSSKSPSMDSSYDKTEAHLHAAVAAAEGDRDLARLQWMLEVGLVSPDSVSLALHRASLSTHPDVLAPVAEQVHGYLSTHVAPYFLLSAARNLSRATSKGRLATGLACLMVAVTMTALLLVKPSPLAPHRGREGVERAWRVMLTPMWAAAIGYVLAYWTGVCVWLTLRGHREPDEEEEEVGQEEAEEAEEADEEKRNQEDAQLGYECQEEEKDEEGRPRGLEKYMAPELARILRFGRTPPRRPPPSPPIATCAPPPPSDPAAPATIQRNHRIPLVSSVSLIVSVFQPRPHCANPDPTSLVPTTKDAWNFDPHLALPSSPRKRGRVATWGDKAWRWTGFAVGTQKVKDERVRRAHQRSAVVALATDMVATAAVMAMLLAVP
ncbi:hypothetical protein ACQY0O_004896 [Thecaphora frezii]